MPRNPARREALLDLRRDRKVIASCQTAVKFLSGWAVSVGPINKLGLAEVS